MKRQILIAGLIVAIISVAIILINTLHDSNANSISISGKEIKTYLYDGNANGILYIPGGNGVFGPNHQKIAETLNNIGFTVLAIDYSDIETLENKEVLEITGISQALSYFPNETKKIILFGSSHGAWIVLNILENKYNSFNEKIIAGIDVSGPTDISALCIYREENNVENGIATECGQKSEEELRTFSPLFYSDKINVPLLILHSLEDKSVPASQSQSLVNKMKQLQKEATIKTYSGSKHGVELIPTAKNDIIKFLNEQFS